MINLFRKIYRAYKEETWSDFQNFIKWRLSQLGKRMIYFPLAFPVSMMVILVSPWVYFRFIKIKSDRVGHCSYETETVVSAVSLEKKSYRRVKTLYYYSPGKVCNHQLHKMWERSIPILPFCNLVDNINFYLFKFSAKTKNDLFTQYFNLQGDGRDKWALLDNIKTPSISFTNDEHVKAIEILSRLGIPQGAKYVCILGRDSKYLNSYYPNNDWSYQDYRDVDINNYLLAAEYLASKGYYVLRMGSLVEKAFISSNPKVIDYANWEDRNDFLDVYLSANCSFFISCSTGIDGIAKQFRRPLLITNLPVCEYHAWHKFDLFIPKKLLELTTGKYLSFQQGCRIFSKAFLNRNVIKTLQENNLKFIENTPEEILNAVIEMYLYLNGKVNYSDQDELLQNKFWENLPKQVDVTAHECQLPELEIQPYDLKTRKMRIGSDYLRNNINQWEIIKDTVETF